MDSERDAITRRSALTRGFGGVALVCSFNFDKLKRGGAARRRVHPCVRPGPFEPFQRDLPIRSPGRSRRRSVEQYVMTMRPGKADILPGLETPILGYDGRFPGPTIPPRAAARWRSARSTRPGGSSTCTCTAA